MKHKCSKCGHVDEINVGSILGSRTSDAKREAARRNATKPPNPGSNPRGKPSTWTDEQSALIAQIILKFEGKPARAFKKNPDWRDRLMKDHTEGALYKRIHDLKDRAEQPEMITPPLPPTPAELRRTDRRGSRAAAPAPKPNSHQ